MSIYPLGEVIRRYRNELNISQECLADGICSVATLSRIENGERFPNKDNFSALMQRLGRSGESYDIYTSLQEFDIHEKKFSIRQLIMKEDYDEANELLKEINGCEMDVQMGKLHKQFVAYITTLIEAKGRLTMTSIKRLEDTLKLTYKGYGKKKICNSFLSYDEIIILNNIAIAYGQNNNKTKAIQMLYELMDYINERYINSEEKMRILPSVLYNLSKYLGLVGRYDECIELCDYGIKVLGEFGRSKLLGLVIYNKAWCMIKLGDETSLDECKKLLLQAYYVELSMGNVVKALKIKEFGLKNCSLLSEEYY